MANFDFRRVLVVKSPSFNVFDEFEQKSVAFSSFSLALIRSGLGTFFMSLFRKK